MDSNALIQQLASPAVPRVHTVVVIVTNTAPAKRLVQYKFRRLVYNVDNIKISYVQLTVEIAIFI